MLVSSGRCPSDMGIAESLPLIVTFLLLRECSYGISLFVRNGMISTYTYVLVLVRYLYVYHN